MRKNGRGEGKKGGKKGDRGPQFTLLATSLQKGAAF